jgi:hypothetical protein
MTLAVHISPLLTWIRIASPSFVPLILDPHTQGRRIKGLADYGRVELIGVGDIDEVCSSSFEDLRKSN